MTLREMVEKFKETLEDNYKPMTKIKVVPDREKLGTYFYMDGQAIEYIPLLLLFHTDFETYTSELCSDIEYWLDNYAYEDEEGAKQFLNFLDYRDTVLECGKVENARYNLVSSEGVPFMLGKKQFMYEDWYVDEEDVIPMHILESLYGDRDVR